jgi:hypothetical protein
MAMAAGGDMSVSNGGAWAMAVGGALELTNGGSIVMAVGNGAKITNGGAVVLNAVDTASVQNGFVGVLLTRQANISENSRVLMSTTQAAAFGAVLGAVFAVFSWLLRRR